MADSSNDSMHTLPVMAAAGRSRRAVLQRVAAVLATPLLIAACDLGEDLSDVHFINENPL